MIDATCPTPNQDAGSVYTTPYLRLLQRTRLQAVFRPRRTTSCSRPSTPRRSSVWAWNAPTRRMTPASKATCGATACCSTWSWCSAPPRLNASSTACAPTFQAPRCIFNNVDLQYLRMQRGAALTNEPAARDAAAAMKRRELALMSRVDCIVTPSTYEVEVLAREAPDAAGGRDAPDGRVAGQRRSASPSAATSAFSAATAMCRTSTP